MPKSEHVLARVLLRTKANLCSRQRVLFFIITCLSVVQGEPLPPLAATLPASISATAASIADCLRFRQLLSQNAFLVGACYDRGSGDPRITHHIACPGTQEIVSSQKVVDHSSYHPGHPGVTMSRQEEVDARSVALTAPWPTTQQRNCPDDYQECRRRRCEKYWAAQALNPSASWLSDVMTAVL